MPLSQPTLGVGDVTRPAQSGHPATQLISSVFSYKTRTDRRIRWRAADRNATLLRGAACFSVEKI